MANIIFNLYDRLILKRPVISLLIVLVITFIFSVFISNFRLDASADSLVLEHDSALDYYRVIRKNYGSDEFLIITYKSKQNLFAASALKNIDEIRTKLLKLKRIKSVFTILNAPLIESQGMSLTDFYKGSKTLQSKNIDKKAARQEFLTSPLYKNLLLSPDAKTTALIATFSAPKKFYRLVDHRDELQKKQKLHKLTKQEKKELRLASKRFKEYNTYLQHQNSLDIKEIRLILKQYQNNAEIHMAGAPMIVADSIASIRHDISIFGVGVLCFIIIILIIAFRRPRWIILPMLCCFITGVITIGFVGLVDWPVTVVSSNFISLLLIITLSLTVHLVVRYRELHAINPDESQYSLVRETVYSKFKPCLYTALTTMVAFASLIVSDIRPIIDFGWMMVAGISIALLVVFTVFPALLMLLKPRKPIKRINISGKITHLFAVLIERYSKTVLTLFIIIALLGFAGLTLLTVENRFIDYFKKSTEIYKGMLLIDQKLGGTTPLDVIVDAPASFFKEKLKQEEDFDIEEFGEPGISESSYWFNRAHLNKVHEIHDYLEQLPETGKVLSLSTGMRLFDALDKDKILSDFYLSIMHKRLSKNIKEVLIDPYMSKDGNQLRFAIRVIDSKPSLSRNELIKNIKHHLTTKLGLQKDQVHVTGILVLYNNMLRSLFVSQILTIGVVFIAIFLIFILLFRNIKLAAIAIIPNMFVALMVLGIMGFANIPLDLMTITIAAISIGIGVDNAIHYIDRFKREITIDTNYWSAVKRSHASIGLAMYYTTIIIALGFSILALSDFVPTIYFGLLTGLAMITALIANLTLLPLLIVRFKPFK